MNPAEQALQLRDVHLPASPEFWPPAPGWWIVVLFAAVVLVWISIRLASFWRRKRSQQEIFSLLDDLAKTEVDGRTSEFLASVSTLLRRVALLKFPRNEVAALTGKDWLSFLDTHGGEGQFSNGVGRVLEAGPYLRTSKVDQQGLLLLAKKWIRRNTGKI